MVRLSANTFYQYLSCPLQLWLTVHAPERASGKSSAIQELLREKGRQLEENVARRMGIHTVEVGHANEEEAFRETLAHMREGKTIYQGTLIDGSWVGRPDFLIPKRGRSRLGGHHYTVEDVKLSRELTDEHKFQLTFYTLLLERIQGVRPRYAAIINGDGERIRFDTETFLDRFALTLEEIEKILAGQKPPPFLSSSCKESPWFGECLLEAATCNDLSLLYRLWRTEYDRLRAAGMITIHDLANADLEKLSHRVQGISYRRLSLLQTQAIALVQKTHIVIGEPEFPAASVEIYYDVETDMLSSPELHYLHGLLLVTRGKSGERVTYKPFLVRNPKQEGAVWKRFCAFIEKLPPDAVIYHYGRYERQVIKELTDRYGISRKALTRFGNLEDLSRMANRSIIFPTTFYSLKDLAKYLGFHWRHAEASGINSIQWYQNWRAKAGSAEGKKMLKDILEYNEDDVVATKVLKDFLAKVRL